MPVLCLDTAAAVPVAVVLGATPAEDRGDVAVGRAQDLLRLVDALTEGIDRADITAVVVGIGPGGFTGLRVGVTTARGIAETLGVPLHGMSSLLAVASLDASRHPGEIVWALLDARRGEVFAQAFEADERGYVRPAGELQVVLVDEVDALVGTARRVSGDEPLASAIAHAARQTLADVDADAGSSADVARVAVGSGDPLAVTPRYGRSPDAKPPRMQVGYDPLALEDIDALLALEARCFATPWTRGMYEGELQRVDHERVLVAARITGSGGSGRLVGAGLAACIGDSWHVMNLLVDPIARGRGIGASLLQQLLEGGLSFGEGKAWTLEVRADNTPAIALYRRQGFTIAGRRAGYYADTGEDALVMWRRAGVADTAATEGVR